MNNFNITIRGLHTILDEQIVIIKANSIEEAKTNALYFYNNPDSNSNNILDFKYDTIDDSRNKISLKENIAMINCDILMPDDNWEAEYDTINNKVTKFVDEQCYKVR